MRYAIILFVAGLMFQAIPDGLWAAPEETAEVEIRLANGMPVEGAFKSAAPEGLTVQSAKGTKLLPWKYLSAGTRWRYERPMLAELEAQKLKEAAAPKTPASKTPANKGKTAAASTNQPKATK